MAATLNTRQQAFIQHYLTDANFNATRAAILAGYSPRTAREIGSENLSKIDIRESLAAAIKLRHMDPAEIIMRLSDVARGSPLDFTDIDEDGFARLNLKKCLDAGLMHTIESIEYTKYGVKVKRYSSLDALEKLARIHKMFGDEATQIDIKVLTIVVDALPQEFRAAVMEALQAQFTVVGQMPQIEAETIDVEAEEIDDDE